MISGSVLAPMSFPPQVRNGPVPSEEGQAASPWARKSDSHAHVFSPCQRSLQRSGPVWGRRLASLPGSDPSFLPSCPPEADAPPTCETGSHLGGRRESEQQPIKWFWSMRCPRPPGLTPGWLVAWAPHEYDKENSRFGLAWPMPCSPGARVPLYGWWPVVGEVETPDQQATMRTHPIICPCPSSVGCPGSGRADVFGDWGSGGRYATGRKPLTGLRSTVG